MSIALKKVAANRVFPRSALVVVHNSRDPIRLVRMVKENSRDPIRLARMVNQMERLAARLESSNRPHPARPDGEGD